jgi:hypothetical protein
MVLVLKSIWNENRYRTQFDPLGYARDGDLSPWEGSAHYFVKRWIAMYVRIYVHATAPPQSETTPIQDAMSNG